MDEQLSSYDDAALRLTIKLGEVFSSDEFKGLLARDAAEVLLAHAAAQAAVSGIPPTTWVQMARDMLRIAMSPEVRVQPVRQ